MKIFISHSAKDKWLARRIANDLHELGATTFLDEKEIETGESINEAIRTHLGESDDFLILLSPDSVKSAWVLVELGGAMALGKRLVPILLYVGVNDIPEPITNHLARDISDINKYYTEVRKQIRSPKKKVGGAKSKQTQRGAGRSRKKSPKKQKKTPFAIGQRIEIAPNPQPDADRLNRNINWIGYMNNHCGKKGSITKVHKDLMYRVDIDDGKWWWAHEWLLPLYPAEA